MPEVIHIKNHIDLLEQSSKDAPVAGEVALWRAVIAQAFIDLRSQSRKRAAVFDKENAQRWIFRNTFDFYIVCSLAGINPAYLRRMVGDLNIGEDKK